MWEIVLLESFSINAVTLADMWNAYDFFLEVYNPVCQIDHP